MGLYVDIEKKFSGFTLKVKFDGDLEALGLLGASGSGKSMTLRCIAGLEKPDEGLIILNGRVLFDSEKGINLPCRKRKIGVLFQNYALFPNMTVEDNIGFALEGRSKAERSMIVRHMIKMVKLSGMEERYPSQLSGGQQQRVAMARALAIGPEALLLDEPFSALDDHLRSHMIRQLLDILSDYHGVTMFVTHNMEEAYRVCNKLVVLKDGRVEAQEHKEKLFGIPPTVAAARLTGCKNFSAAKYSGRNELEAVDWGIKLKTQNQLGKDISCMGIRAHYIRMASDNDRDNVFKCWVCFTSESPFRMTVYLSIERKLENSYDYHLQWEISKEKWFELQKLPQPWSICLCPDKILTFNE